MTPGLLESESCSGGRKGKPPMSGPRAQREGERGRRGDGLGRWEVFWAAELGRRERKRREIEKRLGPVSGLGRNGERGGRKVLHFLLK